MLEIVLALGLWSAPTPMTTSPRITLDGYPFTAVENAKNCGGSACVVFSKKDRVRGWFTTKQPLSANLKSKDIGQKISAYRFTDGHTVIASSDPRSVKAKFVVSTNALGILTSYIIILQKMTSKPDAPEKRNDAIVMVSASGSVGEIALANVLCLDEGKVDAEVDKLACRGSRADEQTSRAERSPQSALSLMMRRTKPEAVIISPHQLELKDRLGQPSQ